MCCVFSPALLLHTSKPNSAKHLPPVTVQGQRCMQHLQVCCARARRHAVRPLCGRYRGRCLYSAAAVLWLLTDRQAGIHMCAQPTALLFLHATLAQQRCVPAVAHTNTHQHTNQVMWLDQMVCSQMSDKAQVGVGGWWGCTQSCAQLCWQNKLCSKQTSRSVFALHSHSANTCSRFLQPLHQTQSNVPHPSHTPFSFVGCTCALLSLQAVS